MDHSDYKKAFPVSSADEDAVNYGMDLRDYFAAKAMQSLLDKESVSSGLPKDKINLITYASYRVADAMMERREEE